MIAVNWKQIYEIGDKWVLILYDISENHYVGVPVYNERQNNSIMLKSIGKHVILNEITDYSSYNIKRCIYLRGKPIKISNNDFDKLLLKSKEYFLNYVKNNTNNTIDGVSYNKWCKNKLELMNKENINISLKIGAICWVELGYNIGNELRKFRPAILWRSSSNKKMWTIIPLTSKHKHDNYYFHYDLECKNLGTARIENLINISANRIKEPYFVKNKIATISKYDNDAILKIIKKYYAFEQIENENLKFRSDYKNNLNDIYEKVLT